MRFGRCLRQLLFTALEFMGDYLCGLARARRREANEDNSN
jgi:hypothetical protein